MIRVLSLLLIMIFISGCQAANEAPRDNNPDNPNQQVRVKQTIPRAEEQKQQKFDNQSAQEVARRLARITAKVPGVNDAAVIVLGRTAIVGIDVDAAMDRSRVGTLKYSVAEALREDPFGASAIVTSDPDIMQRLREISADLSRGRPISGFAEELADIMGRIMPQLPNDTEGPADQQ